MNRVGGPLLSLLVGLAPWVLADEERLEPRMRGSERPWDFFSAYPATGWAMWRHRAKDAIRAPGQIVFR